MRSNEPLVSSNSEYFVYTPSLTAKKLFFYTAYIGKFHYSPGYLLKRS